MKFITISDTHDKHTWFDDEQLPIADCIIHAGDVSQNGSLLDISLFFNWYNTLPQYKYKIVIAGNHDFWLEGASNEEKKNFLKKYPNVIYLENESVIIEGIKIYGSPIQPTFHNWAFNVDRGPSIKKYWDKIPVDSDVLITHGPAYNILDKTKSKLHVGCADLLDRINEIKPKFHICGHIHEAYGTYVGVHTTFVNACTLDDRYDFENEPIIFEI